MTGLPAGKQTIILGQTVVKFDTPQFLLDEANGIYDHRKEKELPPTNKFLAGKIKNEHTLYHNELNNADKNFNFMSTKALDWFQARFQEYLKMVEKKPVTIRLSSIWVNEMYANEYNPVHQHLSKYSSVGLSSVMMLKFPSTYGEEYSREDDPMNGQLQFISSGGGQFAHTDYRPPTKIGDFFIFPYDMRHCVYPFNTTDEHRRTLAANVDVFYSPQEIKT